MDMKEQIAQIRAHVTEEMRALDGTQALENLRVKVLGKKGELTALLRGMGQLSPEERPQAGQLINQAREEFAALLEQTTGLTPVLWDERRTTIEAHGILHTSGKRMKDHRKQVDAVAASLILEGYLTRRKLHSPEAAGPEGK